MPYLYAPWREQYVKNSLKIKRCIFCEALRRGADEESYILYRGTRNFIMLNKFPYTSGHLMIAPYKHTAEFERSSPEAAAELAELLKLSLRVLQAHYQPQGFNTGMNLGRSAGAGVADHYHFHVIPRWRGDSNFLPLIAQTKVMIEDLDTTYKKLHPLFTKRRKGKDGRTGKKAETSPSR